MRRETKIFICLLATVVSSCGRLSIFNLPREIAIHQVMQTYSNVEVYGNYPEYQGTQAIPGEYTLIGTTKGHSCNEYSYYPDGIYVLRAEVHKLGGNGVINIHCEDEGFSWSCWSTHTCYGEAIIVETTEEDAFLKTKKNKTCPRSSLP